MTNDTASRPRGNGKAGAEGFSRRERQIMDALYGLERATAAQIHEAMAEPPSYTAVRTLLTILEKKGHVRHESDGVRYVYEPVAAREDAGKDAIQTLKKTFFDDSAERLVAALLLDARKISPLWTNSGPAGRAADRQGAEGRTMTLLQGILIGLEAAGASVLLPPMAWLLAKTYRRSAAGRRLVWVTAFAMLLGLPILALVAPSLAVIALPAPAPAPALAPVPVAVAADPAPGGFGWFDLIPIAAAVWLAGLAKLGAQHLYALVRLELMRRRATPWRMPTPVPVRGCDLLMSEDCPGPMTWGVFRPVIMLPEEALDWPADRLATVLRHEMAHVRRRDGLAQAMAVIACALYWPNPLIWAAARALRREAELAADDTVIAAGVKPSDYAGQLLELAAEWRERRLTPTGLAMAAPPALSQRVQSILSTDAIRTGATAMDTFKLVLLGGDAANRRPHAGPAERGRGPRSVGAGRGGLAAG